MVVVMRRVFRTLLTVSARSRCPSSEGWRNRCPPRSLAGAHQGRTPPPGDSTVFEKDARERGDAIVTATKGFEHKIIQAVRGTEGRTIAKWQAAGWQLVSRDQGILRTDLTFGRPRPKRSLATAAAFAFLLLVAVGGLTLGLIFGDDEDTTAAPADATVSSPSADVGTPATPEPASTETAWEETRDADLTFGETARFRSIAGDNDIPLEITVE